MTVAEHGLNPERCSADYLANQVRKAFVHGGLKECEFRAAVMSLAKLAGPLNLK